MAMNEWYRKISADHTDFVPLIDAITYFEDELQEAKTEVKLRGNIENANKLLPGIVEHRFTQLQEIEAILEYMNIRYNKTRGDKFRKYLEHYNRELSSRDAEKFAEADDEVIKIALLRNEIALIRNQYLSIMKGLEQKSFSITNITKLRCNGLEEASLE
jgi:DNA-directed RNA polymerase subunit F